MGHRAHSGGVDYQRLRDDYRFPAGSVDVRRDRHIVHSGAVRTVAKGRWYAARFLEQMAEDEPEMVEDLPAAACYEAEHDLIWEAWHLVGYEADGKLVWHDRTSTRVDQLDAYASTFARPNIRHQIVPLIHQAKAKDAEAIGYVERTLRAASWVLALFKASTTPSGRRRTFSAGERTR